jgi:hypothetical protein
MKKKTWKEPPNGCQACPFLFHEFMQRTYKKNYMHFVKTINLSRLEGDSSKSLTPLVAK